jgi:hypothetical protein
MYDKEFIADDLDVDVDDLVEGVGAYEPIMTARQRIEIAREEESLRSMLADFDDWDEYDGIESVADLEGFGDYYVDRVPQ